MDDAGVDALPPDSLPAESQRSSDPTIGQPGEPAQSAVLIPQSISFPPIASFSWTSDWASLAAIASSGLPVSYRVEAGPCSLAGTKLTAGAAGTCVVAANQPGDARYAPAPEVTASVVVTRTRQVISFPPVASFSWRDGSATLHAAAGSALPIVYQLVSGPCVLVGSTLTATTGGTCVVTADQAGDPRYEAAPQVAAAILVTRVHQVITFPPLRRPTASTGSISLEASASSGLTVVYEMLSGPCQITTDRLWSTEPGSCLVVALQPGDTSYSEARPVTAEVDVTEVEDGCGCRSSGSGASSALIMLVVGIVGRRRRPGAALTPRGACSPTSGARRQP